MEPAQEVACREHGAAQGLAKPPLTLGPCPLLTRDLPSPAAHPNLQGSRHTTRKEAGGQELGRGVRESPWGETLKQEQVGNTEQRSQDQDMLQMEE